MGLFDGYARQLAAMPSAPARPQPALRRGLIGGGRPDNIGFMERIAMAGQVLGGNGETLPGMLRARRQEIEQQRARTAIEDRLRAALSPMDTAAGSGTGALPGIEQQMAALDEARLLNPQVAEQFAPVVTQRRMAQLTQGRPIEEQLAVELNPEQAGRSYATQFEDMPLAAGTVRTRGNQPVVAAPRIERFDDRFGTIDPMNPKAGATFSAARGPTYDEITRRTEPINVAPGGQMRDRQGNLIAQGAPRVFSAGDGVDLVTEDGNPIYSNVRDPSAGGAGSMTEGQAKDGFNAGRLTTAGARLRQFEEDGFDFGASAITGGQLRGDFRAYEAAALEWTDSMLRLTTGAQAPEPEVRAQMRTYFPQPGDDENVRRQKAEMRAQAEAAAIVRAGPGYRPPAQSGPQPGQIEDGYQFLGGDPANPSSWRRVQ
jgi:hypothetical protein